MVDVVFKKALKEFRLNIFNSYSTALAVSLANTKMRLLVSGTSSWTHPRYVRPQMDDGKSIRYKDLYALFEHILEKTMRQEQRNWRESPVTVWVNTFKVFLDEFMTEYKPLHSMLSKVSLCHPAGHVPHVTTCLQDTCLCRPQQVVKPEVKKRRKKDSDVVSSFSCSLTSQDRNTPETRTEHTHMQTDTCDKMEMTV